MKSLSQGVSELGLGALISRIRSELIDAQSEARNSDLSPMFRVNSVTIEAKIILKEISSSEGGVDLRLVALKCGDQVNAEQVHTVQIHMSGLESVEFGLLQSKKRDSDE